MRVIRACNSTATVNLFQLLFSVIDTGVDVNRRIEINSLLTATRSVN